MMSIHTPPLRILCNLSLTTSEPDLSRSRYNTSTIDVIPHNVASGIAMSEPLPLPRFVFPAKASQIVSSAPLSLSSGLNQRSHSLLTIRSDDSIYAQDTFNSEYSQHYPGNRGESPPVSPRTALPRSAFHKRGTSELIGGDNLTIPTPTQIGTSPKVDKFVNSPSAGSIVQRRGHAHRRSAAISSGDLSIILKPKIDQPMGGSLPNSPNFKHDSSLFLQRLPGVLSKFEKDQIILQKGTSLPLKSPRTTRVGFSDDVQIIPRPLSMASCDSASTVRHGHSVSNSISSLVSAGASNSLIKEGYLAGATETERPRTAEPTLENLESKCRTHRPKRSGSLPILTGSMTESSTDISSPKSFRRWSFFCNELNNGGLTTKSRPTSAGSSRCDHGVENPKYISEDPSKAVETQFKNTNVVTRTSVRKTSIKKQKRVKSWAGSILSNKAKQRSHKLKSRLNSPSLPKLITSPLNDESEEVGIAKSISMKPESETDYVNWKPRVFQPQDEAMSPVIDLDAALGPFNTPILNLGDPRHSSQRSETRKKVMHSALGLGGFSGPGMHYHRRTESAPEFENPRFGFHRLGSSSKMAMEDVFEEDEDEEYEDTKIPSKDLNSTLSSKRDESDSESGTGSKADSFVNQICSRSSEQLNAITNQETFTDKIEQCCEENTPEVVQLKTKCLKSSNRSLAVENSELSSETLDGSDSKIENAVRLSDYPVLENFGGDEIFRTGLLSISSQLSTLVPDISHSLSHTPLPSPVTPFSYDNQFISTAQPSILNEEEFESLLLGGPGPEMRISVDDVPSLMSSDSISGDSTTTGENLFHSHTTVLRFRDGQRSASFSATIANRKRSSIISLSRLINSSHGERSKLAIESQVPDYSDVESQQKSGILGKRISRLMKFWRKSDVS